MHAKLEKYVKLAFRDSGNWAMPQTPFFGDTAKKFQVQPVEDEEEAIREDGPSGSGQLADAQLDPMDRLFGPSQSEEGESGDAVEEEVKAYFALKQSHKHQNALDWWKVHHLQFPTLARMARYYLAIPATSAPSERVFSQGRRTLTWDRILLPRPIWRKFCA